VMSGAARAFPFQVEPFAQQMDQPEAIRKAPDSNA
jgi:hypothetical protein